MTIGIYADSKQQGPPFSPEQLTGLVGWWDATDSASITQVANAVSQWNDKSGNSFHVSQATEANKPITGTTNINGKNTLNFNGTTQCFTGAPCQIVNPTNGEWSAYSVIRTQSVTATKYVLDQDSTSGVVNRCAVFIRTGTTNFHAVTFDSAGVLFVDTTTGIAIGSAYYTAGIRRATEVEAYRSGISNNGPTATTGTPQTSGAYNICVGAGRALTPAGWWQGEIGEIIVYNVAHSTEDRVKVQNYLKAKWGL